MARDELLVIDRTYDFVKWFLNHLAKFPRSHRYGLGQRIETRLYEVMEALIRAKYAGSAETVRELAAAEEEVVVRRLRRFRRLGLGVVQVDQNGTSDQASVKCQRNESLFSESA